MLTNNFLSKLQTRILEASRYFKVNFPIQLCDGARLQRCHDYANVVLDTEISRHLMLEVMYNDPLNAFLAGKVRGSV